MKSVILAALLVVGCGTSDLHDVTTCGPGTPGPSPATQCEVACSGQYKVVANGSATCESHNPAVSGMQMCGYVATVDGVRGCCGVVGGSDTINRFFECD